MITAAIQAEGLSNKDAASRIAMFDINGLLTKAGPISPASNLFMRKR